jgi:hypothetical protein
MRPPHTPHEDRFIDALQVLTGREVVQELSIPRKARRLDAVCRFGGDHVPGLFGTLGPACADRTVLFEHESQPLTAEGAASAWVGLAWLAWHRLRRLGGRQTALHTLVRGTPRPPLAVVVADRVQDNLTGAVPGMGPTPWPGVWSTPEAGDGTFAQGGLVVLDTVALPPKPGFTFWRWLGRARDADDARARINALLGDRKLPMVDRLHFREAVMNQQIRTSETEQETIAQRVRREAREEGRQKGIREARELLLAFAARFAPEALPSLRTIDDMRALREAVDEAITRRLGG